MKVELKIWSMEDKEELIKLCNEVDRSNLSDKLPYPYTDKDAEFYINLVNNKDAKQGVYRGIRVDGKIVGCISLNQKEDVCIKDAEIGYMLLDTESSKGIMSDAVKQMCDLAFKELDIVRITGEVYAHNIASRRVLEKNGFELEGIMKKAAFKNNSLYDVYIYGKLSKD